MNFIGCVPRFIKAHAGWILTSLGVAGLGATAYLVAEEAPEAKQELQDELHWKIHHWVDEQMDVAEKNGKDPDSWTDDEHADLYDLAERAVSLTFMEKLNIIAGSYLPAILVGTGTAGCIIGSQIVSQKQNALLAGACVALGQEFSQYRKAIRSECGPEVDRRALECSKMEVKRLNEELAKMKAENGPFYYAIATLPGVIFEASPKHINNAFYHFQRNMFMGRGSLEELYRMIGLPYTVYATGEADKYGWDPYENEITWGSPAGGIEIRKLGENRNVPVYLIDFTIPPYELERDYGMNDSSTDFEYYGYNSHRAEQAALYFNEGDVVHFEEPELYIQSPF